MENYLGLQSQGLTVRATGFEFLTGFESTFMPDHGVDVLETTRHWDYYRDDLALVREAGIRTLRYPVPWHRIERAPGVYDWEWMDAAMAALAELGLDPIVDPIHHTSFPAWLERGFSDPAFPAVYTEFVRAFARRYPWVKKYTPFNEPFTTAFFCAHEGIWKPYDTGPRAFMRMAVNVGKAISMVTRMLDEEIPGAQIFHVDTCESHSAAEADSEEFATHLNERRFLMHDLILGAISRKHPLYSYMHSNGLTDADMAWFRDHPARFDVLGLDYYTHSEHQFNRHGSVVPSRAPKGFAAVAAEYAARFGVPVMLSETNIRGFVSDRLSWLKYMVEQSELLVQSGVDFRGFCWFPFIDSTDWDSLLRRPENHIDPVGIYWLDDERVERHGSELSECFGALARAEIGHEQVAAYRFREPVRTLLAEFLPQMAHWRWREA